MSTKENTGDGVHVEVLHDHHQAGHGTMRGYLTGFGLSVILTAIPFWLVMDEVISGKIAMVLVLSGLAVVQIIVHMVYFLHMNQRSEGGWTLMAVCFTMIIVVIAVSGSLWIMHHLDANMMPTPHDMRQMP